MFRRTSWLATPLALASLAPAGLANAEVTAEKADNKVIIKIDGQPFAEYLTFSGHQPIVWPILGPTGKPMTRAYPMGEAPNEKKDHPHHRSLWFNHGSVNGVDFWAGFAGKSGTIKHREFVKVEGGPMVSIVTRNDWIDPKGTKVCEDERTLRFGPDAASRRIDFDITLKASEGPVKFGDTKEGTMAMRVAETMKVDQPKPATAAPGQGPASPAVPAAGTRRGGTIVNSEGQTNAAAWGKPAAWVDYHGPVDDQVVGIAILNHPSSFRFPTYWHVRTYGLYAANPFGLSNFTGKKENDGAYTLDKGKSLTFRYRILLHKGDEKEGKVAEAFAAYAKE